MGGFRKDKREGEKRGGAQHQTGGKTKSQEAFGAT
jgi:hypothetical protein